MSDSTGRNPLRWECSKNGCFNQKKRPKIEEFAECLPGKIAFSDIDGITEVNSKFLLLEWKSYASTIPMGQRIMFERMTKGGQFTVFIINGDAESMDISDLCIVWDGKLGSWKTTTLQDIKRRISDWSKWARNKQSSSR